MDERCLSLADRKKGLVVVRGDGGFVLEATGQVFGTRADALRYAIGRAKQPFW
jgi:hypothetical protein